MGGALVGILAPFPAGVRGGAAGKPAFQAHTEAAQASPASKG